MGPLQYALDNDDLLLPVAVPTAETAAATGRGLALVDGATQMQPWSWFAAPYWGITQTLTLPSNGDPSSAAVPVNFRNGILKCPAQGWIEKRFH